jgi:hypothetical protein
MKTDKSMAAGNQESCRIPGGIAGVVLAHVLLVASLAACELYGYGKLGGADKTETFYPGEPAFESFLSSMSGVWYSRYAGIGRTDGFRIGKMRDFDSLVTESGKGALFPGMARPPATHDHYPFTANDYFVLYNDTVYGEREDGTGGNGGWDFFVMRYIGIVRALNIFNGDKDRGAVIIQYFTGGCPTWDADIAYGQRPFFGVYYRVLDRDTVQMANAVDLAALYAGKKYYTERRTLEEALELNTMENEAEFVSWGVVIPQDRETR